MLESFNQFLLAVNDYVWGLPLIILIMAVGLLLTARLHLLQVRHLGKALKYMVQNEEEGEGEVSSFGALCTALSATIGTGNIVGVATAVCAGGDDCGGFFGYGHKVCRRRIGSEIPCGGQG